MPLYYNIQLQIKKELAEKQKEEYTKEEQAFLKRWIESTLDSRIDSHEAGPESPLFKANIAYWSEPATITFIGPLRPLGDIVIPLAELRSEIASQMGTGIQEISLEDLLILIRTVFRNSPA